MITLYIEQTEKGYKITKNKNWSDPDIFVIELEHLLKSIKNIYKDNK